MASVHFPVMREEVVSLLNCSPGKCMVDCTLGGAGHARAIVEKIMPGGLFIGIDQDKAAIENARRVLEPFSGNVHLFHENFANLPHILSELQLDGVDGILADFGISLDQIETSGRGFSFRADEPLDMRMDVESPTTAAEIVNTLPPRELEEIFRKYGEERWAGRIAREIARDREKSLIATTGRLVEVIGKAIPRASAAKRRLHPATKVFMALRIAVNHELEVIETFMNEATQLLKPGGRICIIAFHSLEDRIVKHKLRDLARGCTCPGDFPVCVCENRPKIKILTRKPIRARESETARNPMSRSAVLRAAEKL